MARTRRFSLVVGCLVAAALFAALAPGTAAGAPRAQPALAPPGTVADAGNATGTNDSTGAAPGVAVSVNRDRVFPSTYRVYATDPTVTIEASVGADDGATLSAIELQVGSRTERSWDPQGTEATVSAHLPLDRGNNTVRVIVSDSEDRFTTREFTLAKDDVPPWIGLRTPYHVSLHSSIPNGTVNSSVVTIGGPFSEFTRVTSGGVTVRFHGNETTTGFRDPGRNFSTTVLLGDGDTLAKVSDNNSVRVFATDAVGNLRVEQFGLTVDDQSAPTVALDTYPKQTTAASVDLSGRIADNVWVKNATVHVDHLDQLNGTGVANVTEQLRPDTPYRVSRAGRSIAFEKAVPLWFGTNRIEIRASDHLGQTVTRTITVERARGPDAGRNRDPVVSIDRNRTRLDDRGRVHLRANVSDPDWNLDAVSVEVADLRNDTLLSYHRYGDLGGRRAVALADSFRGARRPVVVRVRAADTADGRSVATTQLSPTEGSPDRAVTPENETTTTSAPDTATATPTRATTTATNATTAGSGNASAGPDGGGGLPLVGSLPIGPVLGFLGGIAPFALGSYLLVTLSFFVLRRARSGGPGAA
ncbi:MAG: hypothetical protein ABEJ31_03155 [Haloarculaceae archaeon]